MNDPRFASGDSVQRLNDPLSHLLAHQVPSSGTFGTIYVDSAPSPTTPSPASSWRS
jgi:hypothetical protein